MDASIAYAVERHIIEKTRVHRKAWRNKVPIKPRYHVLTKAEFKRRLMKDLCIADKE